jgi:hypothetical protein
LTVISDLGDDNYFSTVLKIHFDTGIARFLGHRPRPLRFFTVYAYLCPLPSDGHIPIPRGATVLQVHCTKCALCTVKQKLALKKLNFDIFRISYRVKVNLFIILFVQPDINTLICKNILSGKETVALPVLTLRKPEEA